MFFGYFLGELLLPTYVVRASVSKSDSTASKGFILASIILIVWYSLITFAGSVGELISSDNRIVTDNLIIVDVLRTLSPENAIVSNIFGAFTFLVFISLIHSTFDSFLNNGAISFSKDIISNYVKLDRSQELSISRQITLGISVLGLVIALTSDDLIDILFYGYTVWVPFVLAPLIWIILNKKKKLNSKSFWYGLLVGFVTWIIFRNIEFLLIPSILAGLISNYATIALSQFVINNKNES